MSLLKFEPFAAVESMDELLAIAYAMEQEAIAGYSELAERMRREGRPDMVPVFERLIGEESEHLGNVVHWSERICSRKPDLTKLKWQPAEMFDDEGAGTVAPELLSAYRAFSMAVRNEERAFLFWTYVAAQADRDRLREAAEQMAREGSGTSPRCARRRPRSMRGPERASKRRCSICRNWAEARRSPRGHGCAGPDRHRLQSAGCRTCGARTRERSQAAAFRPISAAEKRRRIRHLRTPGAALRAAARPLSGFRRQPAQRGGTAALAAVRLRRRRMPVAPAGRHAVT